MARSDILSKHDAVHDLTFFRNDSLPSSDFVDLSRDAWPYEYPRLFSSTSSILVGALDSRLLLLGHNMNNSQIFSVLCGHHSVSTSPLPHRNTSHLSFLSTTCQHHTSGRGDPFIFLASLVPDHGYGCSGCSHTVTLDRPSNRKRVAQLLLLRDSSTIFRLPSKIFIPSVSFIAVCISLSLKILVQHSPRRTTS